MRWKAWIEHITNPLHVYCRLIDVRLPERWARRICRYYEKFKSVRRESVRALGEKREGTK